ATELGKLFVEAIIAPGYDSGAMEILAAKKNLRVISVNNEKKAQDWARFEIRRISGGVLLQNMDEILRASETKIVTARKPTEKECVDLDFAWRVAKHVKSNAIVLAEGGRTIGVGAGQMSRVDSVQLSIQKAFPSAKGAVLGSDAFFPFRDSIDAAAKA